VPGGGNYDGDVGVIGAIEVIELLEANNIRTRHPLEVVVFSDEEGGLTGSRAMVGGIDDNTLSVMSHSGMTIEEGIRVLGGDPEEDVDIGVVEGIVGIRWWDVTIEGFANHAGTTPMNRRWDAMVSAAEYILAVNRVATSMPGSQVATVGKIHAAPGAPNVIPGEVVLSLEIRDLSAEKMQRVFDEISVAGERIADARATPIRYEEIAVDVAPAPTDERVRRIIAASADILGLSYRFMPSGAGHDAQDMALIAPTGMIFVPSAKGISHSPQEFTSAQDMANGATVLFNTVLEIDGGALE
jgi:N-carbamoyl-L-amino-acid hydrolase